MAITPGFDLTVNKTAALIFVAKGLRTLDSLLKDLN